MHNRIHTREKPFKCKVCEMLFGQKIQLKRHKCVQVDAQPHKGKILGRSFGHRHGVTSPKQIHTGEQVTVTSENLHDELVEIPAQHPYNLETSVHTDGQVCVTKQDQTKGNGEIVTLLEVRTNNDTQKYAAKVNEESMKDAVIRTVTEEGHEGGNACEQSAATNSECSSLVTEAECANVSNPVNHNTTICWKALGQRYDLTTHEHFHLAEKPYECKACGKSFANRSSLLAHNWTRKFKCGVCEKSFCQQNQLMNHECIHMGDKPYKSKVCGLSFGDRHELTSHEQSHTGELVTVTSENNHDEQVEINAQQPCTLDTNLPTDREACMTRQHKEKGSQKIVNLLEVKTDRDTHKYVPEASAVNMLKSADEKTLTEEDREGINSCEQPAATNSEYTSLVCGRSFGDRHELTSHEGIHMGEQVTVTSENMHDEQVEITAQHLCSLDTNVPTDGQVCVTKQLKEKSSREIVNLLEAKSLRDTRKYVIQASDENMLKINDVETFTVEDHEGVNSCEQPAATNTECTSFVSWTESDTVKNPVNHSTKNSSMNMFKCKDCDKCFTSAINLMNHMSVHTGEKLFQCEVCGKVFDQKHSLRKHSMIHTGNKPHECKICLKTFMFRHQLTTHERIHTGEKPYKCKVCGKSFGHKSNLETHKRIHTGEKPFKCEVCKKSFHQRSHLKRHSYIHTGDKPYECKDCGKSFGGKYELTSHARIHTGEKPYECKICGKSFAWMPSLKLHSLKHTSNKPHVCSVCGKAFAEKEYLALHNQIHTDEKPYECTDSWKSFVIKTLESQIDMPIMAKPFKCQVCGKYFTQKSSLRVHNRLHTGKPYKCKDCGKAFISSGNLKIHNRLHTGEKPFECKICGKAFKRRYDLSMHDHIHTGEVCKCNVCGKSFSNRGSLGLHNRIHNEEKPYKSKDCDISFCQKNHLRRHNWIHMVANPYKCRICGRSFGDRHELTSHEGNHMGEQASVTSENIHDEHIQITAQHPSNLGTNVDTDEQVQMTKQHMDKGSQKIVNLLEVKTHRDTHEYVTEASEVSVSRINDAKTLTVEDHEGVISFEQPAATNSEYTRLASGDKIYHSKKSSESQ